MSLVMDCCPRAPVHLSEDLLAPSDLARCLPVLLWLMDWSGSADDLLSALPHAKPDIDLTDLRNTLAVLGYPTRMQGLKREVSTCGACRPSCCRQERLPQWCTATSPGRFWCSMAPQAT